MRRHAANAAKYSGRITAEHGDGQLLVIATSLLHSQEVSVRALSVNGALMFWIPIRSRVLYHHSFVQKHMPWSTLCKVQPKSIAPLTPLHSPVRWHAQSYEHSAQSKAGGRVHLYIKKTF